MTTDPSTPLNDETHRLLNNIKDGNIDSEPETLWDSLEKSSPCLPELVANVEGFRGHRIDVPIVLTSSSPGTLVGSDLLSQPGLFENLESSEPNGTDGCLNDIFQDDLALTLEDFQAHATLMAEQEQCHPIHSISRVTVPVMDFATPLPTWTDHVSCPKDQFSWMRTQLKSEFSLPFEPQCSQDERSLKWAPLPPGRGRISTQEPFEPPSDPGWRLLSPDATPTISSVSYVKLNRRLAVLELGDEEELDGVTPGIEDEISRSTTPRSTQEPADLPHSAASNSQGPSLESLVREVARKRHRKQVSGEGGNLLDDLMPSTNDVDATSKLLSGFMEMRAVKRPRATSSYWNSSNARSTGRDSKVSQQQPPVSRFGHLLML